MTTARFGVVDSESASGALLRSHRGATPANYASSVAAAPGTAATKATPAAVPAPAPGPTVQDVLGTSAPARQSSFSHTAPPGGRPAGTGAHLTLGAPKPSTSGAMVLSHNRAVLDRADPTRNALTRGDRELAAIAETSFAPLLRASGAVVHSDGTYAFVVRPGETSVFPGAKPLAPGMPGSPMSSLKSTGESAPPPSPGKLGAGTGKLSFPSRVADGVAVQHGIATYVYGDPAASSAAALFGTGGRVPSAGSTHAAPTGLLIADGHSRPVLNPAAWGSGRIEGEAGGGGGVQLSQQSRYPASTPQIQRMPSSGSWRVTVCCILTTRLCVGSPRRAWLLRQSGSDGKGPKGGGGVACMQCGPMAPWPARVVLCSIAGDGEEKLPPSQLASVLLTESEGWGPGYRGKKRVPTAAEVSTKPRDADSIVRRRGGQLNEALATKLEARDTRYILQPETHETRSAPPPAAPRPGMRVVSGGVACSGVCPAPCVFRTAHTALLEPPRRCVSIHI